MTVQDISTLDIIIQLVFSTAFIAGYLYLAKDMG
jgi:hypothetical protein